MTILIHKDIFSDISKFKEVCDCVVNKIKPKDLTLISDFKTMRFDETYSDQRDYSLDSYIIIDSSELSENFKLLF